MNISKNRPLAPRLEGGVWGGVLKLLIFRDALISSKMIYFVLCMVFSGYSSSAVTDFIDSTQYDINDPRNPDCPCHQLQKIADEEYARLQQEQKYGGITVENKTTELKVGQQKKSKSRNHLFMRKRQLRKSLKNKDKSDFCICRF